MDHNPQLPALYLLYAEDDPFLRKLYAQRLSELGFRVRVACDGAEAARLFDSGERCDAVLTDYQMPNLNGIDLTRHIRGRSKIPIVLLTSDATTIENEALAAGATKVFSKRERFGDVVDYLIMAIRA